MSENICPQCGGLIRIEYTMGFERCLPVDMRVAPNPLPPGCKLCPGHDTEPETRIIQGGACWACGTYGTDMRWWHAGIYGDDGKLLHNERLSFLIHKDAACARLAEETLALSEHPNM
jgi:hypothetical protein